jgi:hypothetical protein
VAADWNSYDAAVAKRHPTPVKCSNYSSRKYSSEDVIWAVAPSPRAQIYRPMMLSLMSMSF